MKALVKYDFGRGNVELRDMPIPVTDPNEVKIEVKAAGICQGVLHTNRMVFQVLPEQMVTKVQVII